MQSSGTVTDILIRTLTQATYYDKDAAYRILILQEEVMEQ